MAIWAPAESDTRAKQWVALEKAFGKIAGWLDAAGKQGQFFMGDRLSFADFILGARLIWMKRTLGEDSDEWRKVAGWHGGRWAKFLEALPQECHRLSSVCANCKCPCVWMTTVCDPRGVLSRMLMATLSPLAASTLRMLHDRRLAVQWASRTFI